MKVHVVASLLCLWVTSCLTFDLTVLHTNDCHARIEQADGNGGSCGDNEAQAGKCFGGVARRLTKIREIRNAEENVILLDGGDQFQGTLWFHFYHGLEAARFMNKMQYDAMAFGNHEFDNKIEGVIPFLQNISHPMVCANIDASKEPELQRLFQPSVVLTVGGQKIAVIGYVTPNTTFLSFPGPNLVFKDEVAAITAEVRRLQSQGVNKFIALGHSGIKADITIAKQVPGLDLVVGGHSNTFLYEGTPPEDDKKYGEYPLGIPSEVESGRFVLVVQDYAFGKYLGYLKLKFNDAGEVIEFNGNPILLNSSISQDSETLAEVASMKGIIANLTKREVGRTHVFLDGRRETCRRDLAYGFVVTYDLSKPVGERVVRLEARCSECKVPQYQPVEKQKRYKLLINSYIADGGDGFTKIKDNTYSRDQIGYLDSDLLFAYLKDASPITTGLERRITFVDSTAAGSSSSLSAAVFVLLMSPILTMLTALFP